MIGSENIASKKLKEEALTMSAIFTAIMLLGFASVWAIDYEFTNGNGTAIPLWSTNQDTTFTGYDIVNHPQQTTNPDYWTDRATGQYVMNTGDYIGLSYPRSPVYQGNDTWVMNVNTTTGTFYNYAFVSIPLVNCDNWIIEYIHFNFTKNTDTDLVIGASIDYPLTTGVLDYDQPPLSTGVFSDTSAGSTATVYNRNVSFGLNVALDVHENSQGRDSVLMIAVGDPSANGLTGFAFEFTVTIYGQNIAQVDITETVALTIGVCTTVNVIALIYMTDSIDIIPRNDLKRYRKRK